MAIYSEFSHEKWWFSIAMLVYQRVISGFFFAVQYSELTERQARIELLEKSKVGFPSYLGTSIAGWFMEDPKIKIDDLEKKHLWKPSDGSGFNDF